MKTDSFKNFSYVAVARIGATALQAIFYLIFAALLEPAIYGEMNYIIAIAGTFSIVARFGLPYTVSIYRAKEDHIMSSQVNILALLTTSIAALVLIPINLFAAILSLAISFFVMNQHNLLGLKKYKKQFHLAILRGILLLVIPIIMYLSFEIPGILLGMAISNFIAGFPFLKYLNRKTDSFRQIKKNYKVLIHNFGVEASTNLPRMVDKLLIVPLLGFAFTGIYQFNMQILFALEMLPIALHSFLLPEESSGKIHKKIIYLGILISALLTVLTILIAPSLVSSLFPKYAEGIFSLQILVMSLIPLTISSIFYAKLQSKESTKIGYSAIIRISSLLGFIAFFGIEYGLVGLSIAVLLSIILNTVFLSILYYRMK